MSNNKSSRKLLQEVSLIRPMLIVLLVLYHAFCMYNGNWRKPVGYEDVTGYAWVARAAYAFMLEMFVFVSGYVWAYQREELGRKESFFRLASKKFGRLMGPGIVFSGLYLLVFGGANNNWGG